MDKQTIKILIELFAGKYSSQELQKMLLEALAYDSDVVLAKMEKMVMYTTQISREDVITLAKSINYHIIESDIDYVLREFDNREESRAENWTAVVENLLYERKNK